MHVCYPHVRYPRIASAFLLLRACTLPATEEQHEAPLLLLICNNFCSVFTMRSCLISPGVLCLSAVQGLAERAW